ncbi:MAG: substrate-binding domain-containing protein [Chloroflexota bacterium]
MQHRRYLLMLTMMLIMLVTACDASLVLETSEPDVTDESNTNQRLVLATTTSTNDSGLLDAILPDFEAQTGINVEVIAVGTGQALALGEAGDADVLLVHARAREDDFVASGNGSARYDVMFNDFVIIGAEDDPAGIAGDDADSAFTAIAETESLFISRGDDSGTHTKELAVWDSASITPDGDWYQEAGQGMGAVITIANEQRAYTLTDRGTFIARSAEGLDLIVLVEGDPILSNPYGVIPVSQETHPDVNADGAQQFVDWLLSVETQETIANYQVNGQQLFFPDSDVYREAQASD